LQNKTSKSVEAIRGYTNVCDSISANRLYGFEQFNLQTVQSGSCERPAKVTLFDLVSLRVRLS
jgi:hypothetical protein